MEKFNNIASPLIGVRPERNGANEELAFAHDSARLVSRNGATIQYGYDAFLLTSELTLAGVVTRGYDDDFRVTSLTLNGSFGVSYSYDDDGLLTHAGDVLLNRDPTTGFLTSTVLGNITDQRTYNGFGEVANYIANIFGNPVYSVAYGYDALGRITNQSETIGGATVNKSYVYDNRGRVIQVATDGTLTEEYTCDANGNRIFGRVGAELRAASYDSQDRMLSYGAMAFGYSLNGNQTNRTAGGQSAALSYDLFGQLSSVSLSDSRAISYDLDALSHITAKKIDGAIVKGWMYKDGLKPIAETDASGNVVSVFVYGSGALTPDYMVKGGNTYRLIRDHVGSIRLVIDVNSGSIAQRLDYDSFGNVLQDTNPGFQPFGFQSGLYDSDTGFIQFGARWYDPLAGRWLSKDSLLLAAGWNVYTFCGNNPVMFIDPLGLDVYWINRKIGGQETRDSYVSHSFLAVQHPDKSVETYSWGNTSKGLNGQWNKNRNEDGMAALEALSNGQARRGGDQSLDPYIQDAFDLLRDSPGSQHWWHLFNNCKNEADKLLALSQYLQANYPPRYFSEKTDNDNCGK